MLSQTLERVNAELRVLADLQRRGMTTWQQERRAPVVNLQPVIDAFTRAVANGVRTPSLHFGGYQFSRAPDTGRNPGAIYVRTREDRGGLPGTYLGKVVNGLFLKDPVCRSEQQEEILQIARDPAAAFAFGRKFGRCSVCNRALTDAQSIERAIGPVCARKFGF